MKFPLYLFLNLLIFSTLQAQNFHRLDIPVSEDGVEFSNAWAGGLNSPQWSQVNLNNDGKPDLYAFDRNGEMHLPFINVGEPGEAKYEYAPWLAKNWPRAVNFAYLRDFDHDGTPDLFTQSFNPNDSEEDASIKVFRGSFNGWKLNFQRILFPEFQDDLLYYTFGGEKFHVKAETPDLPAITDVDNDGDLDILALSSSGNKVAYYKNIALESGYTDDTLIYELNDDCWGQFYIQPFAESLTLSNNPDECAVQFTDPNDDHRGLHGGATLCAFDNDGDGDMEILYGDLIFPYLIFGENGGDTETAWMNDQDTTFPSYDVPVEIDDFPAPFCVDMDYDGLDDFIAGPNLPAASFDYEVVWFYKNIGTADAPFFSFQGSDFFTRDMLDFGSGANPTFFDYNADGLMDIVVGNSDLWDGTPDDDPFLVLLENVGTATEPAFEIVDRNWLNLKSLANVGVASPKDFAPTFGDLDSDGDLDLLVGERHGRLIFAENLAGPGQPAVFGPLQPGWKDIVVGQYSTPVIWDVNGDGLQDLIIGERKGTVNYMPNIGTATNPDFHPDPDEAPNNFNFGGINTQDPNLPNIGFAAPVVLDLPEATYIVSGSLDGFIEVYLFDQALIDGGNFEIVSEQFGNLREGDITRIAFAELNGDEYLDCVIGNDRGGMGIFQSPITVDGLVPAQEKTISFGLNIFPNPTSNRLNVQLRTDKTIRAEYRIINALGQLSASGQITDQDTTLSLQQLQSGIYFLQIEMDGEMVTRRIVKN